MLDRPEATNIEKPFFVSFVFLAFFENSENTSGFGTFFKKKSSIVFFGLVVFDWCFTLQNPTGSETLARDNRCGCE